MVIFNKLINFFIKFENQILPSKKDLIDPIELL